MIHTLVNEILAVAIDDGLTFDLDKTSVETIRDDADYPGLRAKVSGSLATAMIRFHIDISIGDPIYPEPRPIELPRLLGSTPLTLDGYSAELVLAEKIVTALQRGTANTRWRDFVDIAQPRWAVWRRKQQLATTPEEFAVLLTEVTEFVDPVLGSLE